MSVKLYEGDNPLLQKLFDQLGGVYDEYVSLTGELAAATGDKDSAVDAVMKSDESAKAVQLRERIQKAMDELRAIAEKRVAETSLTDEEIAAKETRKTEIHAKLTKAVSNTAGLAETMGLEDDVVAPLERVREALGKRKGASGGAKTGSSLPRVPVDVYCVGNGLNQAFNSFSALAVATKSNVETIQKAFAEAAGVKHEDISSVKRPVDFTLVVGDVSYEINTKPKDIKRPGRKVAVKTEETVETVDSPAVEAEVAA